MKHFIDVDLYMMNTMRLHCVAANLYEPESEEELRQILKQFHSSCRQYHLLGGGSNVLMPERIDNVISLRSMPSDIFIEGRIVRVGASMPIQRLIRLSQKKNLGGLEFLFTLPCQVGGAIYMNAGRGGHQSECISDYLKSVTYIDANTGDIHSLSKEQCLFSYRKSIFQKKDWVILSAELELENKSSEIVQQDIEKRLERSRIFLDAGKPSCGSVFCKYNSHIMKLLMGLRIGNAQYSKKTINWISNIGAARYVDVLRLIRVAIFLHRITFQDYMVEIRIWR